MGRACQASPVSDPPLGRLTANCSLRREGGTIGLPGSKMIRLSSISALLIQFTREIRLLIMLVTGVPTTYPGD